MTSSEPPNASERFSISKLLSSQTKDEVGDGSDSLPPPPLRITRRESLITVIKSNITGKVNDSSPQNVTNRTTNKQNSNIGRNQSLKDGFENTSHSQTKAPLIIPIFGHDEKNQYKEQSSSGNNFLGGFPLPSINQDSQIHQNVISTHQKYKQTHTSNKFPIPTYTSKTTQSSYIQYPIVHKIEPLKPSPVPLEPTRTYTQYDQKDGEYTVRCVCGKNINDDILVLCDRCQNWLHGSCVNIARTLENEPYYCPFCIQQVIRCSCGNNDDYTLPLIQCTVCHYFVHKDHTSQNISYGFLPSNYVCFMCGKFQPEIPYIDLTPRMLKMEMDLPSVLDKMHTISKIPDGIFRSNLEEDLKKSELFFCQMMSKYFNIFIPVLSEYKLDFWNIFVTTFSSIFDVNESLVLDAIDVLTRSLLYDPHQVQSPKTEGLTRSSSIKDYINTGHHAKYDKPPKNIRLDFDVGGVFTTSPLEDGQFITDLPGFLLHTDEINADRGLQDTCLKVTDKYLMIDIGGGEMDFLRNIRRSFHYNCLVKLYKLNSEVRVGLYATRLDGPYINDREKKGPAIDKNCELILQFDGDLPFTMKLEWKDKKSSGKSTAIKPDISKQKKEKKQKKVEKGESFPALTLLSSFLNDNIPPLPFEILSCGPQERVPRTRNRRQKGHDD